MTRKPKSLTPEKLRYTCDADCIPFKTTDEAPVLEGPLGQERATSAIDFGLRMKGPGYNLFTVGMPGSGRRCRMPARASRSCSPPTRAWVRPC